MTVFVNGAKKSMQGNKYVELGLRMQATITESKLRCLTYIMVFVGLLQIISGMLGMHDVVQHGLRSPYRHHYFNCLPETWETGAFESGVEVVLGMFLLAALMHKNPDQYVLLWIVVNVCLCIISWTTVICAFSREDEPSTIAYYGTHWMMINFSQLTVGLIWYKKSQENDAVNKILQWTSRQKSAKCRLSKYFQVEEEKPQTIPKEGV